MTDWRHAEPLQFEEALLQHAAGITGHPAACRCQRCAIIRRDERRARARRIIEATPRYPSLCMLCISRRHAVMLTGYCLTGQRCDGCGNTTDLALTTNQRSIEP